MKTRIPTSSSAPGLGTRWLVDLRRDWYPLLSMLRRDIKIRYALTSLGIGWAVLQPLLLILLYTFVFSVVLKVRFGVEGDARGFALHLACGLLPYLAFAEAILRGSTSLTDNRSLLDKVVFPAEVLPAVGAVTAALTEFVGLLLIVLLASFLGVRPSPWLVLLPVVVLLRVVIALGLAWLVSVLKVFVSDLGQILGLLLLVWMFFTPIFYPPDIFPDSMHWLLQVNPLYHVATAYRAMVLEGRNPLPDLPVLAVWAAVIPAFGLWFFRKTIERAKDFL